MSTYRIPIFRLKLVKDKVLQLSDVNIDQPPVAARLLGRLIGDSDRENLVALFLDVRKDIVGAQIMLGLAMCCATYRLLTGPRA